MDANDKLYNYMISNNFYEGEIGEDKYGKNVHRSNAIKNDMVTSKKFNAAGIYLWSLVVFILMTVLLSINMTM
tara:strand:+ start:1559 stop:1777 length:219 start_codon:yes stop_codon:yes gene_type:complete